MTSQFDITFHLKTWTQIIFLAFNFTLVDKNWDCVYITPDNGIRPGLYTSLEASSFNFKRIRHAAKSNAGWIHKNEKEPWICSVEDDISCGTPRPRNPCEGNYRQVYNLVHSMAVLCLFRYLHLVLLIYKDLSTNLFFFSSEKT